MAHERVLRALEQLCDPSQALAVGYAIHVAARRFMDGNVPIAEALRRLNALIDAEGLDVLDPHTRGNGKHPGNLARPRVLEIAAALNRLRTLGVAE